MIKSFILDTNVLLQDPDCIYKFEENNVIIPMGVIEELDKFKKELSEVGKNARKVARALDCLRGEGRLTDGVHVNGGILKVVYDGDQKRYKEAVDLQIIHVAQKLSEENPEMQHIVVTRDVNVRLRADVVGVKAENYRGNLIGPDVLSSGYSEIFLNTEQFAELSRAHVLEMNATAHFPNEYLVIKEDVNTKRSLLGKVSSDCMSICTLKPLPKDLKIEPKNKEQHFALNALFDPNIHLVCLVGRAGSGKTIQAVAAGHYQSCVDKIYSKMLISRPIMPMGKDIGFLPGSKEEKLEPWMQPIYDALNIITGQDGKNVVLRAADRIGIEALTYIRGRSIYNQFMIIDEAQQLMPLEAKTILTRASNNTKIVLTGDIDQIDNPYVDQNSNGLVVALQAFKSSSIAAHILLDKGVRSQLSEEASRVL